MQKQFDLQLWLESEKMNDQLQIEHMQVMKEWT